MNDYRRAVRPVDSRLVGGVAAGLADHFGVRPAAVRVAFVVGTWFSGAGIIAYLLLWRFLPLETGDQSLGLESAERRGLRVRQRVGAAEAVQAMAILALGAGVLVLLHVTGRGIGGIWFVPLLVGVVGVALVWRQFDDVQLGQWVRQTSGTGSILRLLAGLGLIVVAAVYFLTEGLGWTAFVDAAAATAVAAVGLGLILGPWVASMLANLTRERRERVRSQERADVAAHLHDSVLQTLALLQKNAGDPAAVATLARRQERDLRSWLYGQDSTDGDTLVGALRVTVAEVEADHRVPVDLVSVGDVPLGADMAALARAAREAVVNAAKHSGADKIDVYVEVGELEATVFVRDRGAGFDPDTVADDRMGLRGSIIERIERHGGSVEVRSAVDEGCEVRMSVPVEVEVRP